MKNKLILSGYYNKGKISFTLSRSDHHFGQHILPLSLESMALLFPQMKELNFEQRKTITVSWKKEGE